jgi:hypothetical protein
MLEKADQAYVVVGDTAFRSKSMDAALKSAIAKGLDAHQIVLSASESPRLDPIRLPRYKLNNASLDLLFEHPFIHATNSNARKLLQTPTRDAAFAGHDLRKAHEQVRYYLAVEFLSELLGVEEYAIRHTKDGMTDGLPLPARERHTDRPTHARRGVHGFRRQQSAQINILRSRQRILGHRQRSAQRKTHHHTCRFGH